MAAKKGAKKVAPKKGAKKTIKKTGPKKKAGKKSAKKPAKKPAKKSGKKETILVTGSSGRIGKALVALLAKSKKFRVRVAVHTASKADYLKSIGADEVVAFDLKEPSTWGPAVKGCSRVFSSSLDPLITNHMEFSKFLGTQKKNIKHVVRISCFGADTLTATYDENVHTTRPNAPIPLVLQHYWWGEECLIKEGLPVTVLRGNFFMNHLLKNEQDHIEQEGYFASPLGECRNSFVSTTDMAVVANQCFSEGPSRHANKFYDITGPQPQSMHEVAADLSKAMKKKVIYKPQDMKQFEADFGATRAAFFEYLNNGFYTRCSPDFYNVVGRRPTPYYDYLTETGPFGETGLDELFSKAGSIYTKGKDIFKDAGNVKRA